MIFYYSATGNSYWAAQEIAPGHSEQIISVTDALNNGKPLHYAPRDGEAIGFIFPVHAWNPPDTLLQFIEKMTVTGMQGRYVYAVATCGDSTGHTMRVLDKALRKKGLPLLASWEIQMPNNYLPLQDVDSPETEQKKLAAAETAAAQIKACITDRRKTTNLMDDRFPRFKTGFIGFFFRKFGKNSRPFYVTEACTGCGLCKTICLKNTIAMQDARPHWGNRCDQCFACINRCPHKAIQYGKKTETRGRYCHPCLVHEKKRETGNQ